MTGWPSLRPDPAFSRRPRACRRRTRVALDRLPRDRATASARSSSRACRISRISTISTRCKPSPACGFVFAQPGAPLPAADLVILPGSKATIADLKALRAEGWDIDILAHARRGGKVLGLCGGYQMLGRVVADPEGVEGPPETAPGLGLIDAETVLGGAKTLTRIAGRSLGDDAPFPRLRNPRRTHARPASGRCSFSRTGARTGRRAATAACAAATCMACSATTRNGAASAR